MYKPLAIQPQVTVCSRSNYPCKITLVYIHIYIYTNATYIIYMYSCVLCRFTQSALQSSLHKVRLKSASQRTTEVSFPRA